MPVSLSDAREAVRLAREAIGRAVSAHPPADPAAAAAGERLPPLFDEPRGVFVTLRSAASGHLRGCIGYPLPLRPLRAAVPEMAVAAALEDPRFPPLAPEELARVAIELSLLTPPVPVAARDPAGRRAAVVVGRDGLILEYRGSSGLLLPQVAVEEEWDADRFLAGVAEKAGLPPDAWQDVRARLSTFQAEVFVEVRPGGDVRAEPLRPATGGPAR